MQKRRVLSFVLAIAMIATILSGVTIVSAEQATELTEDSDVTETIVTAALDPIVIDFTTMTAAPVYSAASGQGFVEKSSAIMPSGSERQVAPASRITVSGEGASVTESDASYIHKKTNSDDGDDFNNGGMIYRYDTDSAGAYHLEVTTTGTSSDTRVAPTGMDSGRLTGTGNWDNCGMVPKTVYATWNENTWSYDFATGEDFIEIEIEPSTLPTSDNPQTVGVKTIKITPLDVNPSNGKPTIHILGDSTQKSYSFNETISSWGQTLKNYFDLDKVNVINYSMGGRAMKSNYQEGRAMEALITGREGDFVFIHSAHNDETVSKNRFSRGAGSVKDNLTANNANYNTWLDMYVKMIKARGMTPVLVTAMPRTGSGKYSENTNKPNGFNPDSPGNMRAKAKSDSEVGLVELYDGAKAYIDSLDSNEIFYIYNTYEAGETPANNAANGTSGDGTHYREAIAKQFCRIMLQSIYDQSVAETDTYTDKAIMQRLVSYMPKSVQDAAKSGDWSAVYPEMASDVSTVGIVPGAKKQAKENYYYRPNIEKALEIGALHKNEKNEFKPTQTITVGDFARGIEKVFGISENSLTNYTKTYAELLSEAKSEELAQDAAIEDSVVTSQSDDMVSVQGEVTVSVTQPKGGSVTVYNNSAYHTMTADIPSGVSANKVISDNEYFKFTAPSEITNKTDKNGKFSNSSVSVNYIEIRNNGTKQPEYIAKADGTLTMYLMFVDHKAITCENMTDGTKSTKYINNTTIAGDTKANQYSEVTFDVVAGKTYQIYTNGGTGRLFGVGYASTDYPSSTESLSVNSGDEIRVALTPDENYIVDGVLVDGVKVSKSREYTFKAEKNTAVSAVFTKEPECQEVSIASDAALTREVMGAILYDAYQEFQKSGDEDAKKYMATYMSQNGSVPSPDDPNYDPNIKYEGNPYIPLTGWGALTDKGDIENSLYFKLKSAYNLGLIRPDSGIARGSVSCGTKIEAKTEVSRAKAAKSLVFCYILTQKTSNESQMIPNNQNMAAQTAEINVPNSQAPSVPVTVTHNYDYEITKAVFDANGSLSVELSYSGTEAEPKAKLIVASYDKNDESVMTNSASFDVEGTSIKDLFYIKPENGDTVKVYLWDGVDTLTPIAESKVAGIATLEPTAKPTEKPTATPAPTAKPVLTQKATVVTATGENFEYKTISEAVAKAVELNPKSESERVTVNVDPADYEEQVRIDNAKFITLQQTPGTSDIGRVNISWYYCTGYSAANADLSGLYNPKIDWSLDETWNGYKEGDEKFTRYEVGQSLEGVSTISYYDKDGVVHKDEKVDAKFLGSAGWGYDKMAPLIVGKNTSDITVKDFNCINSIVTMVTQGQIDGHVTPEQDRNWKTKENGQPVRSGENFGLTVCSADTVPKKPTDVDIYSSKDGGVDKQKLRKVVEAGHVFDAEESAWLVRSSAYNECGHAIAILGDRITIENVRASGNQDSVYTYGKRAYFKNCTLIGGTDYIYGSSTAVFDSCKLGLAGFTDKKYGSPISTPANSITRKYGYLFWNCIIYNEGTNCSSHNFGGPWGKPGGQVTYYNTTIDDNASIGNSKASIIDAGWGRFNAEDGLYRLYEYGTKYMSGKTVDLSKRLVNKSVEDGGPGMGTVLDKWQALEFNPRNYLSIANNPDEFTDNWDPAGFSEQLKKVDAAFESVSVEIPSNDSSEIELPSAPDGVEYKWASNSANAVVSSDGKKLNIVRPAVGENSIKSSVILYAMDTENGYGDKKEIEITITPTTDTTNVFTLSGNVSLSVASDSEQSFSIVFERNGAVIKTQTISVPSGSTSMAYTAENIPVGTYNVTASIGSADYNISEPSITVSGAKGDTKTFDITAKKMVNITVQSEDFSNVTASVTSASGLSAGTYTASGSESANLGSGNTVYKLTKDENAKIAKNAGVSFDLKSMLESGTSLKNTKTIKFSYDFLMESTDYYPSNQSWFDFATSKANGGNDKEDQTRFVRWAVYKGWGQFNLFGAANQRINGDNTQFARNNNMANKWYRIVADVDLENKVITTTLYDRDWKDGDNGTYILNKKAFNISDADSFPTNINLDNLYFNVYMTCADTTNKMEYYFDNLSLEYQDYE